MEVYLAYFTSQTVIPLVSTFYGNISNSTVKEVAENLLKNSRNERIQKAFKDVKFINSLRQPPNLQRELCHSRFINTSSNYESQKKGIFKCNSLRCKICKIYLQECNSFLTANGFLWEIRCFINCNSRNIAYHLICNVCNFESYTGITDCLRIRTNNHITACRHGSGSDKFDKHVFNCAKSLNIPLVEPYFKMYVYLTIADYQKLRDYESLFHSRGYDTMNRI